MWGSGASNKTMIGCCSDKGREANLSNLSLGSPLCLIIRIRCQGKRPWLGGALSTWIVV